MDRWEEGKARIGRVTAMETWGDRGRATETTYDMEVERGRQTVGGD